MIWASRFSALASAIDLNAAQQRELAIISGKIGHEWQFAVTRCPTCSGSLFAPLADRDRYGLAACTAVCRDCGLIQTAPRLRPEDYLDFYRHHYRILYNGQAMATNNDFEQACDRGRNIFKFITKHVRLDQTCSALEVGAGSGGLLHIFAKLGIQCLGHEIDDRYGASQTSEDGVTILASDIHAYMPDRAPELIIYNRVLEHIYDLPRELKRISVLLNGKGHLFISVPGIYSALRSCNIAKIDFRNCLHIAHLYHFSLATLKNLMAAHGFELVAGTEDINSIWRPAEKRAYRPVYRDQFFLRLSQPLPRAWQVVNLCRHHIARTAIEARRTIARWRGRR